MRQIKFNALIKIKEGKLDEFKRLIPQFISIVKEKDPGTVTYDWYLNEEAMECTVLETYADSDSVLAHFANAGGLVQKLLEFADLTIELYGNPSNELLTALDGMAPKIFPYYSGL
jgi:quinol monooxygenase YgiN